jgi:hypothetical protein
MVPKNVMKYALLHTGKHRNKVEYIVACHLLFYLQFRWWTKSKKKKNNFTDFNAPLLETLRLHLENIVYNMWSLNSVNTWTNFSILYLVVFLFLYNYSSLFNAKKNQIQHKHTHTDPCYIKYFTDYVITQIQSTPFAGIEKKSERQIIL